MIKTEINSRMDAVISKLSGHYGLSMVQIDHVRSNYAGYIEKILSKGFNVNLITAEIYALSLD